MTPGDRRPWLPVALLLLQVPVTLENLTEGDAGTYRCGIDTSWLPGYLLDVTFHVVVSVTPGSLSLSGPSTVMGTVGGSLRVQCRYEEKYKTFTKYWCRQPCLPLWNQTVATRGSEEEMRSGRVSIVDHPGDLTFTVTLENLTVDDTGKYRCGIATILHEEGLHGFLPDLFFQVQVFVSPRSLLGSVHFLLLILLKVPLFLIMLSAVLWVNRPQWATCGTQSRPDEDKRRPSLSIDILSRDTATQTRGGRTSDPKPSISSHLIAKNW
ncbi:protein CD300H-like isoform X4 [Zalophus californianus]|uniref:Protein CD300H-like isoform X4 n=1 Tax=Zalophus californianus TaxID=9704 RepID=A0A6P9F369_ZALCA|nr:protein CD300H-like isoform X4 [Zalophus californianus]